MNLWKQRRVEEGAKRNEAWRKLSPTQQLASLDKRLGEGVGAKRQRAKLALQLKGAKS